MRVWGFIDGGEAAINESYINRGVVILSAAKNLHEFKGAVYSIVCCRSAKNLYEFEGAAF